MSKAWDNLSDPGYNTAWHTGKVCSTPGCDAPAGTIWYDTLCAECTRAKKNKEYKRYMIRRRPRVYASVED
jgi:hypothetical protein